MPTFNILGQEVQASDLRLKNPAWGKVKEDGSIEVFWAKPDDKVDRDGFDKSYKGTHGYYDEIELPVGTVLGRFGSQQGRLTAPQGTPYEKLGMPYERDTIEYHEYVVVANGCFVKRGLVSPMFDSPGGGFQYLHGQSIEAEIESGYLEEDYKWKIDLQQREQG